MATTASSNEPAVLHTLDNDSTAHSHSSREGAEESKDHRSPFDSAAASTNNEEKRASNDNQSDETSSIEMEQSIGVTKIEALYIVFGKGWKLVGLWLSILLIYYVFSLGNNTIYNYTPFATSAFGAHSVVATIDVINGIMSGVSKPFIAKMADLWSRPGAMSFSVLFFTLGVIIVAAAQNITAVCVGLVIYTLGNSGINFLSGVLVADITSLQWRAVIQAIITSPNIINGFLAGDIAAGVNAYGGGNGWRWGYGMFAILVPVCIAPSLIVLFWGDRRAKKLGALSLASSTYARQQVLKGFEPERRTWTQAFMQTMSEINAFGLLLMGFAFGCILAPFTLVYNAEGGYTNPSMIALLVVGGLLLIAWAIWDGFFARYPIMPKRVINRTLICAVLIDFNYFFSGYLSDAYWGSWLWVTHDLDAKQYSYMMNILTVGLTVFAVLAGVGMRLTHRYKHIQMFGLSVRIMGMGLNFLSVNGNHSIAVQIMSRVLISIGGGCSVMTSQLATQASVPHQDMAIAIAILGLWTSIGGGVGSAIAGAVWTQRLPAQLQANLGDILSPEVIAEMYGNIYLARVTEPRDLVIRSYDNAVRPLYIAALATSTLSLFCNFFMTNYKLDNRHNAIETKKIEMRSADETNDESIASAAAAKEERIRAEVVQGRTD